MLADLNPAAAAALAEMREADHNAKTAMQAHWHHIQKAAEAYDAHNRHRDASLAAFRRYNDLMDQTEGIG